MAGNRAFVGYKSQDRERVRSVVQALIKLGYEVFWDQEIAASDIWRSRIIEEIKSADVIIICWSQQTENPAAARWLLDEADEALRLGKKLCPVQLEPCTIPMGFRQLQTLVFEHTSILDQQLCIALDRPAALDVPSQEPRLSHHIAKQIIDIRERTKKVLTEAESVVAEAGSATNVLEDEDFEGVELDNIVSWEYSGQVKGPLFARKPHGYGTKSYHEKEVELRGRFDDGEFVIGARYYWDDTYLWKTYARFHAEIPLSPVMLVREDLRTRETLVFLGEATGGKASGYGLLFDDADRRLIGEFSQNPLEQNSAISGWFARVDEMNEIVAVECYDDGVCTQAVNASIQQIRQWANG